MNRQITLFSVLLAAQMTWASEGTHLTADQLDAVVDRVVEAVAEPQVLTVTETEVVTKIVETEKVVEVPAGSGTISAGIDGDTAGGCDIPNVHVFGEYATTDGMFTADGRVQHGGNRACRDATSVDISLAFNQGPLRVTLGYDQRGVSFVGPAQEMAGDYVFFGSMQAPSAVVAYAPDMGALDVAVGYDVPNEAVNVEVGYTLMERIELDYEIDSNGFSTIAAAVDLFAGFEFRAGLTSGMDQVPDPISWKSDEGYTPGDPPSQSHFYTIAWGVSF